MEHLRSSRWLLVLSLLSTASLSAGAQTLTPTSVNFGNWAVGNTGHASVYLRNTLVVPLTILGISVSGDFGQSSTCPLAPNELAAGEACSIPLTFTPTALGLRTATLTINDDSSTSPQAVALSGNGENPVGLAPLSQAFGLQVVHTTSAAKTFTLQNYQTVPVNIASISTSGDFAQTSDCPVSPNTLPARLNCKILVTFTPTSVGVRTGELTIRDDAAGSPQGSSLRGTGTSATVTLSPTSLTFADQVTHTTGPGQVVTLQNGLSVPLTISAISTAGDFSRKSTTCPGPGKTLAAGGSCTISVVFTPTTPGIRTGALSVSDSASASIQVVGLSGTGVATPIEHVVIIFQENRSTDNLFHDPVLISRGADIASSGLNSNNQVIPLKPAPLANTWDMGHNHAPFVLMYNGGKMNGADKIPLLCQDPNCPPPAYANYTYVQASDVGPYFQMAEEYTFADRMFQTNQGPSFPAHQFIISGTSAPTADSNLFAADNPMGGTKPGADTGCTAPANQFVKLINPAGSESQSQYPCFEHQAITDSLDGMGLSWRYYTTSGGLLWTGPNAIEHIRLGPDWANVIIPNTTVLSDIHNGKLPAVSWVIPNGLASDHPRNSGGDGPSWVASVVNAIGNSQYWKNTAILITWDDWGGWYDHVAPPILNSYEYGFRVPLIVVSPYAKAAYISHTTHDFGSMLKFIEKTYNLPSLGYADASADDLSDCFDFSQTPLTFHTILAPLGEDYFLNDKRPPVDPDDD